MNKMSIGNLNNFMLAYSQLELMDEHGELLIATGEQLVLFLGMFSMPVGFPSCCCLNCHIDYNGKAFTSNLEESLQIVQVFGVNQIKNFVAQSIESRQDPNKTPCYAQLFDDHLSLVFGFVSVDVPLIAAGTGHSIIVIDALLKRNKVLR